MKSITRLFKRSLQTDLATATENISTWPIKCSFPSPCHFSNKIPGTWQPKTLAGSAPSNKTPPYHRYFIMLIRLVGPVRVHQDRRPIRMQWNRFWFVVHEPGPQEFECFSRIRINANTLFGVGDPKLWCQPLQVFQLGPPTARQQTATFPAQKEVGWASPSHFPRWHLWPSRPPSAWTPSCCISTCHYQPHCIPPWPPGFPPSEKRFQLVFCEADPKHFQLSLFRSHRRNSNATQRHQCIVVKIVHPSKPQFDDSYGPDHPGYPVEILDRWARSKRHAVHDVVRSPVARPVFQAHHCFASVLFMYTKLFVSIFQINSAYFTPDVVGVPISMHLATQNLSALQRNVDRPFLKWHLANNRNDPSELVKGVHVYLFRAFPSIVHLVLRKVANGPQFVLLLDRAPTCSAEKGPSNHLLSLASLSVVSCNSST